MLFNSLQFLAFFPVVVLLFFLLRPQHRWVLLLAASYYFYMAWKPVYVLLVLASTLVDFWVGLRMGGLADRERRRPYLFLSILVNLGLLLTFKYLGFFTVNANAALAGLGLSWHLTVVNLVLPLGISFYTFQTLSYSVDVYLGRIRPQRHLGRFALYVTFFPQLVAGPIERATDLMPQLERLDARVQADRIIQGLQRIAWGFFKKLVIADRLTLYVDQVYANPEAHGGGALLIATYFFAFQIYCDFSGYCDIAIGAARVLGIELTENFRCPYFATSIREFWARWHVTLCAWFRDYVYIPLGGSRVAWWRGLVNVMIVFLVSGFWHGASWTFIVWGCIHGVLYCAVILITPRIPEGVIAWSRSRVLPRVLLALVNFHVVLVAWIFFRAGSVEDAWVILTTIAGDPGGGEVSLASFGRYGLLLSGGLIAVLLAVELWTTARPGKATLLTAVLSTAVTVFMVLAFGVFDAQAFIYFQF